MKHELFGVFYRHTANQPNEMVKGPAVAVSDIRVSANFVLLCGVLHIEVKTGGLCRNIC